MQSNERGWIGAGAQWIARWGALGLTTALLTSCLVDNDKVCGDAFVETKEGACACPKGQVVKNGHCVEDPAKPEKPADDTDATTEEDADDETRSDDSNVDEPVTTDDGEGATAPESDDGGVRDPAESETDPESTSEEAPKCSASTECQDDQLCDVHDTEQCVPKPDGLGQNCTSSDDCANTEATYCEAFQTHTCQIEGCKDQDGVCPGDMVCCDFALLGTSLCVTPDSIEDGMCPAPGMLVERGEP